MAIFLATLIALIAAAYQSIRGQIAKAGRIVLGTAGFWVIYLAVVAGVSLATPRRVIAIGEQRCFDDWCITVERVSGSNPSGSNPIMVTLRVASVAKRITQAAPDTTVQLEDSDGRLYSSKSESGQPTFATKIGPGESFETMREFEVPDNVKNNVKNNVKIVGVVVRHGSSGPGAIVIGDDAAIFHKPAIVKIPER